MTTTRDDQLVQSIIATWDADTVRALARLAEMGIAAAKVADFLPNPEMRALVAKAERAVRVLDLANVVRPFAGDYR